MRHFRYYLIGCYLITTPFWVIPGLGMYDTKRIIQLLLFTFLAFFFLSSAYGESYKDRSLFLSRKVVIVMSFFFGVGFLSSFFSEFTRYAFIEFIITGILFLCGIQLSESTLKEHYFQGKFIYGFAISFSSLYLIYFFGNYIASHLNPLVPMWPDRIAISIQIGEETYKGKEVLNFAHKRFFNHIQTWTLPLIISSILYFKSKSVYRNLILVLLVCWWCLVFASGARGTLVSFIFTSFFVLVLFRKQSYRFLVVGVTTAMGGFLLYFMMFEMFVPSKSLPVVRMSGSGRIEMWAKALELWLSNPVLGTGPMHYAVIDKEPYFAHPHNFYLQLLSEWGIIALLSIMVLLLLYFLFIKREFLTDNTKFGELSPRKSAVYMGFIGSAVAGWAHAGVSGVFHTPISQIWLILVVSWLISLWNRKSESKKTISVSRRYFSSAFLVLLVILWGLVSYDLNDLNKGYAEYKNKFNQEKVFPRFWQQGLMFDNR